MPPPDESCGRVLVTALQQVARSSGLPKTVSVDAIAQVLAGTGMSTCSPSSLRRLMRGNCGPPKGSDRQWRQALTQLAGTESDEATLRRILRLRDRAAAEQRKAAPPERRRPFLTAHDREVPPGGQQRAADFVTTLLTDLFDRPSARALGEHAQIGGERARAMCNGRTFLLPDAFRKLLQAASRSPSPPDERTVADLMRRYVQEYAPEIAVDDRWSTKLRKLERRPTEPTPADCRLSRLSSRNRADADVSLAPFNRPELRLRDVYVKRTVEAKATFATRPASLTLVVGEAGAGKSSLLWHLAERAADAGRQHLLLRATDLTDIESDLGPLLSGVTVGPLVLIDTVDLLLREGHVPAQVRDIIETAVSSGATVVLTCRPLEKARLEPLGRELGYEKVELGSYDADELPRAVAAHARAAAGGTHRRTEALVEMLLTAAGRGLPLREILRRPLTLRMLFELDLLDAEPAEGPDSDSGLSAVPWWELDVTTLYAQYWHLRILDDVRGATAQPTPMDATAVTELVSSMMLAAGRADVDATAIDTEIAVARGATELRRELVHLHRRGMLLHEAPAPVEFFHQTFFEYAAARTILALGDDLVRAALRRVVEDPKDLWFAAVVQQLLVLATSTERGAARVDHALAELIGSDDPDVAQLAVAAYGQARHRGELSHLAMCAVLADPARVGLVGHFLGYLPRALPRSPEVLLDELQNVWLRPDASLAQREEVLMVLRGVAASRPLPVAGYLLDEKLDLIGWLEPLEGPEVRRRHRPLLALLNELAPTDPRWVQDQLMALGRLVVDRPAPDKQLPNAGAVGGLAGVLAVAVKASSDVASVDRFLALVPDRVAHDARGVDDLKRALADLLYRRWQLADGAVDVLLEDALRYRGALTGAQAVRRSSVLWAVAKAASSGSPEAVESVLDVVESCDDRQLQSCMVDDLLRRLLEETRSDGDQHRVGAVLRRRCASRLSEAAADRPERPASALARVRTTAQLWRDAIDHSDLDAADVASVLARVTVRQPETWTRPTGLAALVVRAALGGDGRAQAALAGWSTRVAETEEQQKTRRIIADRLATAARTDPSVLPLLVSDAAVNRHGAFVKKVLDAEDRRPEWLSDIAAESIVVLARELLSSGTDTDRADGLALLVKLGTAATVATSLIVDLFQTQRLTATESGALNLLEMALGSGWDPAAWSRQGVTDLDALLDARIMESPKHPSVERWRTLQRELVCRHGDVGTAIARTETTTRARRLVLAPREQKALAPLGYLLEQLSAVDPVAAADLLAEASHTVLSMRDGSWKGRRAHRWRAGVIPVIRNLSPLAWRATMTNLAGADPDILTQAVTVSVAVREDRPERFLTKLLAESTVAPSVQAEFRNAQMRRQRIVGGTGKWDAALARWHTARGMTSVPSSL